MRTAIERDDAFQEAHDQCCRLVNAITKETGQAWTFGYIGDLTPRGDDSRSWYAFAPHPGRVGEHNDRIGGYPTDRLDYLVTMLRGALQMARVQKVAR